MRVLIRAALNSSMVLDAFSGIIAGALTVVIVWWMASLTAFVTIPARVLLFSGLSVALGLVNSADLESVRATFRTRGSGMAEPGAEALVGQRAPRLASRRTVSDPRNQDFRKTATNRSSVSGSGNRIVRASRARRV
jgi:hypothetical protein